MLKFNYFFNDGAFIEIKDSEDKYKENEYLVEFINQDTQKVYFSLKLKTDHWAKTSKKYYINWLIRVTFKDKIVYEKTLDFDDGKVFISFDSSSLGDTIGWMPFVEEFRRKHNLEYVTCSTFHNPFFEKLYPNIIFVEPDSVKNEDYMFRYILGYFGGVDNLEYNVENPFSVPLQKIASGVLGLEHKELHSPIYRDKSVRKIEQKYVCIAEHSTAQCKYWNNPNGWQTVVNYLLAEGYIVYSLSSEKDDYMGNKALEGTTKPEDTSLETAMSLLEHCDFFIGLSSGFSWLAWALKVKVILISGFTEPWMEFLTGCIRLHNDDVCNGCWNHPKDYGKFDRGDWNWCPKYKGTFDHFICSKSISATEVIDSIKKLENDEPLLPYNEFEKSTESIQIDEVPEKIEVKVLPEVKKESAHYVRILSGSLGDTICWMPYVEQYREKHKVDVHVNTSWNNLFIETYPDLTFIEHDADMQYTKQYFIDYYPLRLTESDLLKLDNHTMVDYRNIPIQLVAPNVLGLPMIEVDGTIDIPDKKRNIQGKYVVVAIQSTAQLKYWNNPVGWERVFDFLKKSGYKIVLIDRWKNFGNVGHFNQAPKIRGLIDKTGDIDMSDRIIDIKYADMVITLSSGLAWVAWALDVSTVMISGFTKPWNEFKKNIKRIHNDTVCNGCWNDDQLEFKGETWSFCPRNKDFECSVAIQPAEVIQAIKDIELEKDSVNIPNSKGEVVDKVTILQIKLENIKDEKKNQNIRKEYKALKDIMETQIDIFEEDEDYQELLIINRKLWKIEDDIRDKEGVKEFDDDFIQLARDVYYSNDERSEIKRRINMSEGSSLVEEKSYKKYN